MNFCENCNFMLYTKLEKNGYNLTNYCKNCGLEVNHSKDNTSINKCVYKKSYSNDYLANNAFVNKYTRHDPTLPRINNILCVNPKCLTNLHTYSNYDSLKSIYLSKIDNSKFTEEEIDKILSNFGEDFKKNYVFNDIFNDNQLLVITFKETENLDYFKTNFKMLEYEISDSSKEIEREIIFMKYDYINLKYLYVCSTCNTSWNNE